MSLKLPWDIESLHLICERDEESWLHGGTHYFHDNNSSILAVAHLDCVQAYAGFDFEETDGHSTVHCTTLDDRLGVYIITELLPTIGVTTDILLSTDARHGESTAQIFIPEKRYHWIFSFDRKGSGVVLYQYGDAETIQLMQKYGFDVHEGYRSDIVLMDHLECKAFNFGCGYHEPLTDKSFAVLDESEANILRFQQFYNDHKNTLMPHVPSYL